LPTCSPVVPDRVAANDANAFPGVQPVNLIDHHREHTIDVSLIERLIQPMEISGVIDLVLILVPVTPSTFRYGQARQLMWSAMSGATSSGRSCAKLWVPPYRLRVGSS
jgi:hypothetical protein